MRVQQRSLDGNVLIRCAGSLEIIEAYEDDKYLPSYLLRGECDGSVFHVQIAVDEEESNIRVVTMYLPDNREWDSSFRVRRTKA